MPEAQQTSKVHEEEIAKKRGRSSSPPFPRNTLKQCLALAESIEKNNAGQPFDRLDLAKSLDSSPNSSGFRTLIISAGRYGVAEGGYQADKIGLTKLGSSIVAPTADDNPNASLRQALTTPEVFKGIYEKFNKKNIPREDVFKSTLKKEFGIEPEDVDTCYKIIMQNIDDYNLAQEFNGNKFLNLDKLSTVQLSIAKTPDLVEPPVEESLGLPPTQSAIPEPKLEVKSVPKVFISHSKNANILQQLKTILEFGAFEYKIAEEEETAAIPVPDKVFGLMRQCNCAIINISADEEMKQPNGIYRINENVLIEIGAAFVHYDKRVILLVDKRIELPSNLQGLYKCEYEGDELSFLVAMKLQKALTDFRKSI